MAGESKFNCDFKYVVSCDPIWYVCYFAFICHSAPRYDFWKEQNLLVYKEKDAAQLSEQF